MNGWVAEATGRVRAAFEAHRKEEWDSMHRLEDGTWRCLCLCGEDVQYGGGSKYSGSGEPGSHARHRAEMIARAVNPDATEGDIEIVHGEWRQHSDWFESYGVCNCMKNLDSDEQWLHHMTSRIAAACHQPTLL